MPSKVQEKIEENEEINKVIQEEFEKDIDIEDMEPSDVELSDEQKEALKGLKDNTATDALSHNELEVRTEQKVEPPIERTVYKDANELSSYISYLFYEYHTNQLKPEEFYKKLMPHVHEDFKELLPIEKEEQIITFEVLQEQFLVNLPSPIVDYKVTNVAIDKRYKEATFYRMYEMKNQVNIYYMTYIKQTEDGQWLMTDDRPAPPYKVEEVRGKFKSTKE